MAKPVNTDHPLFDETLNFDGHGGGCCGRSHVYDFDCIDLDYDKRATIAQKALFIKQKISGEHTINNSSGRSCCVEAVLNENQLSEWKKPLLAVGFKQVFQFCNINSGRNCYVFLLDTSKVK